MRVRSTILFFVLFSASCLGAFSQGFQGGLRGSVKDAGGAVIPGVAVTLTNEATNLSRSIVGNESGEYDFAALEPGSYKLTAAKEGFKTTELAGIRVGTQQFVTLDLKL